MAKIIDDFDNMNLNEKLLRGIYGYGYEKPSSIQQKAVYPGASGKDLLIHAQSGTGKTGAFSISALNRLNDFSKTEILVLSPTRDLAIQTGMVMSEISQYMNIKIHTSIGGTDAKLDAEKLRTNPNVVTGTPGRICDQIKRENLNITNIKVLIIDEVDEMLSQGFSEEMKTIVNCLPDNMQIIVASATFRIETHDICEKILKNPVKIQIKQEEITLEGIKQFYVDCTTNDIKPEIIVDLYEQISITQSVIFVNTKRICDQLGYFLKDKDFSVSTIHGELTQSERDAVLKDFKSGKTRILIASDVLARGIDIQQVSIVINYDLPTNIENYVHRIGRSGRFGRKGVSINLIASQNKRTNDIDRMNEISKFYSTEIEEMPMDFTKYF
jgi:translation initiation factor 4A